MIDSDPALNRLVTALERLPGIGIKTAERLAHHLLKIPADEALKLAEAIREVRDRVHYCVECFHLTESESETKRCVFCSDPRRDRSILCVVEQSRDLLALEASGSFRGLYHVLLGRLSPLEGVGADQLTLAALKRRVIDHDVREVILATNPTLEGDSTALVVAEHLSEIGVTLTRLARGLASGNTLEFANKEMLSDAFQGRRPLPS